MTTLETFFQQFRFNRGRTLATLDQADEAGALMWRPGEGRAHIAWQIAHVGITEDIFSTERLAKDKTPKHANLWDRFRGGSTPDDEPISSDEIKAILSDGRDNLLDTLARFNEDNLNDVMWVRPESNRELTLLTILQIINWHEAHHQGQAHLTLNLYKAAAG
jgi:uncharacterized damage-inducible protein DinB